jgi:hypothetical protein
MDAIPENFAPIVLIPSETNWGFSESLRNEAL